MDPLIEIFFFALGAIIASFIGVIVARLNTGQSFLVGHSRCDACSTPLMPRSLVPIVSFIRSRGRAACCGARIAYLAPLSELILATLFVLAYLKLGWGSALAGILVSLSLLLALVLYDLQHQILPSVLLYPFIGVSALSGFLLEPTTRFFSETVVMALILASSLATLHFLSRGRAMGFADAPLTFGLSLLVGPLALSGFVYSFWIGAVVGSVLLLTRRAGSRMNSEVPFAPFLAAGFLLAYFTQWSLTTFLLR